MSVDRSQRGAANGLKQFYCTCKHQGVDEIARFSFGQFILGVARGTRLVLTHRCQVAGPHVETAQTFQQLCAPGARQREGFKELTFGQSLHQKNSTRGASASAADMHLSSAARGVHPPDTLLSTSYPAMKRILITIALVLASTLAQGEGPLDETRFTLRQEFLRLINSDRKHHGLKPVE